MFGRKACFVDSEHPPLLGKSRLKLPTAQMNRIRFKKFKQPPYIFNLRAIEVIFKPEIKLKKPEIGLIGNFLGCKYQQIKKENLTMNYVT